MACNGTGWRSADNSVPSSPATEVDYLLKIQVIFFLPIAFRLLELKPNKELKVEERFRSARIYANLHVSRCLYKFFVLFFNIKPSISHVYCSTSNRVFSLE
jgi:hypothetical protein